MKMAQSRLEMELDQLIARTQAELDALREVKRRVQGREKPGRRAAPADGRVHEELRRMAA